MKKNYISLFILFSFLFVQSHCLIAEERGVINLSGEWDFEQTDKAWPPSLFTRVISVPGLIDLAIPKIEKYNELFLGDQDPKYSWYRKTFTVPQKYLDKKVILTILKSRFNTQVIINGIDVGTYLETSTPIECDLTKFIKPNEENTLLVRVDDINRNPVQSAYSKDIEQFTYIPGIWDEVFISFTGPVRVARSLSLPNVKEKKVTVKLQLQNHDDKIKHEFSLLDYDTEVSIFIKEKKSGKRVSAIHKINTKVKCLNRKEAAIDIPLDEVNLWSPDSPFLYEAVIEVTTQGEVSDYITDTFGMRDFGTANRKFVLNGEEVVLLGSNISLARFFGDRERSNLPWDKEWVKKLLIDIPKSLRWNSFRNTIGLLPDFWYSLADEYGIMIQDEWPMWKNRGWNNQIEKEYTDWVWVNGSHPSIIIWDAMNESRHEYIGKVVIPKLKKLDPTRIWDAGHMDASNMALYEMGEPHYYPFLFSQRTTKEKLNKSRSDYRFGRLIYDDKKLYKAKYSTVPQVANEYCWVWLNRDGSPAFISKGETDENDLLPKKHYFRPLNIEGSDKEKTPGLFKFYLGSNTNASANREFQAYILQLQTEALRSQSYINGVQSFTYLTNDKGYTGDWFLNPIKDLLPSPTLVWQFHSFSPFAVFIDEEDGKYLKNPQSFEPGKIQPIRLIGINDTGTEMEGELNLKIIDINNETIVSERLSIKLAPHFKEFIAANIKMPSNSGGYILVSELTDKDGVVQISRRYIRVGDTSESVSFPNLKLDLPENWPK
ncbi:MAG: hypothetical protein L3J41_02020 [Melioribacteraceae bacterium]|nr:hypothetical protein [Melioribacteraceae bacterium]